MARFFWYVLCKKYKTRVGDRQRKFGILARKVSVRTYVRPRSFIKLIMYTNTIIGFNCPRPQNVLQIYIIIMKFMYICLTSRKMIKILRTLVLLSNLSKFDWLKDECNTILISAPYTVQIYLTTNLHIAISIKYKHNAVWLWINYKGSTDNIIMTTSYRLKIFEIKQWKERAIVFKLCACRVKF